MRTAEGRDGYDIIEEIAKLQWFIASLKPPHFACITPLQGASDFYHETLSRDGVPSLGFAQTVSFNNFGKPIPQFYSIKK
jgi:predicted acyl esterase